MTLKVPNRIVLISRGRHDEAVADSDCYPGMLLQKGSTGNVAPHATAGAGGPPMVCREDALRGGTTLTVQPSGNQVMFQRAASGDRLLMLLQKGQNIANIGTPLMSAGDGTLIANPGMLLYEINAPSATITNTTVETTFVNSTYSIPANYLSVGDVLVIRGRATVTGQNSTNTHTVRVYIGSTLLASSGAVALAAASIVEFVLFLSVRTIGSTGTFVASGYLVAGAPGTATPVGVILGSTTIDTTVAQQIKVTSTASAASAGNIIQLDEENVMNNRDMGFSAVAFADEAKDNSGGIGTSLNNAMFIRVTIP